MSKNIKSVGFVGVYIKTERALAKPGHTFLMKPLRISPGVQKPL